MSKKFTNSFKIQAVEKVLLRDRNTNVREIADSLGVGYSTIQKWVVSSKNNELTEIETMNTTEKRPQDWSAAERLNIIIKAAGLNEEELNSLCRVKGIFPHHIDKWKSEFSSDSQSKKTVSSSETKHLKSKVKNLERELRRKEKALAETAALLVLQKKVNELWPQEEDD